MKRFLLITSFILPVFAGFAQSVGIAEYEANYNRAPTWQEKRALLQQITAANVDGSTEFYARAFNVLTMTYPEIRHGGTEWTNANAIARILIAEFVSSGYEAAGENLWRCYRFATDPVVRADSLVALGELKIEAHYDDVQQEVNRLNADESPSNRQNDEIIAAAGFTALEKYGKPEGYVAAFIGTESWYREGVKESARAAFTALLPDASRLLPDIILSAQYSASLKQKALLYVDGSSLDDTQKADIASQTLAQGWLSYSIGRRAGQELIDLRRSALQMIRKYGSNGTNETYTMLTRSLRDGDLDEKIDGILALGALNTPESATVIIDYVDTLNETRRLAISRTDDDRLMRSLVPALGASTDRRAAEMLRQTASVPWSNTVLNMVRDALTVR
jgi:hypothetical protein